MQRAEPASTFGDDGGPSVRAGSIDGGILLVAGADHGHLSTIEQAHEGDSSYALEGRVLRDAYLDASCCIGVAGAHGPECPCSAQGSGGDESLPASESGIGRGSCAHGFEYAPACDLARAVQDEPMVLPELTEPVDLCDARGRLNPLAVGWSRSPMHRSNLRGRGRVKRWEYWAITQGDAVFAVTVSDLDYAALYAVYVLTPDGREFTGSSLVPLQRVNLADRCGDSAVRVRTKSLAVDLISNPSGMELTAQTLEIKAAFTIERPVGHESLAVVVPWGPTRFQYTVKENTLPARGDVIVAGERMAFDDAFATMDHGRGKWPYAVAWNWGSGSGIVDGRVIGIQIGGAWTDGTGSTENALCVDGRIHYIPDDLRWEYDVNDWMRPWRITDPRGGRLDLTLTPRHVRSDTIQLGVLANDTHQAFGTWSGWMSDDSGRRFDVGGVQGWSEEVRNRW